MKFKSAAAYSEPELIQLFTGNESDKTAEQAFVEIYHRYWNKLLAIAYNHLRDKQAAEEVVQEIFAGLWERRGQITIVSLSAYLATAVKFSVFKTLASDKRHKAIIEENYFQETVQWAEEEMDARFLAEYLDGVTESLPEKCRLVFVYSRREGLSIPDIASEMKISPKTVEAHLSKALRALRTSLKDVPVLLLFHLIG